MERATETVEQPLNTVAHEHEIKGFLVALGVRCLPKHAKEVVVDLDSMGHLVHGLQEGRHYIHGRTCFGSATPD